MKKQFGFTLVEVMIAAAALGGLALVGMQLMKTQARSTAKNSFDSETILITNEIVGILSDPAKCLVTLGGKSALSTLTGINSINSNKFFSIASGLSPANGYGNASVNITSYEVVGTAAQVAAKNSSLNIYFQNKNILKGVSGPSTINKKINLYVEVDGLNNITFCRSLSSSSTDIWTRGTTSSIYYSGGNVGIGTIAPNTTLDVAGQIRPGSTGVVTGGACSPEGSLAYDIAAHSPVFCKDDLKWTAMGGNGGTQISMYQCPGAVSLGGGAWGFYGCQGQITNKSTCYEVEYPTSATFACAYIGKMTINP